MRKTSGHAPRRLAALALVGTLAGVGLVGVTVAMAASANAAGASSVSGSVSADNACGDDTREDRWNWWDNPKPRPCERYTFDRPSDGGDQGGGRPPKDAGQGASGGAGPDQGVTGGTDQGSTSNTGGGQQGGSVPVVPSGSSASATAGQGATDPSAGSDVAAPVAVTDAIDPAADGASPESAPASETSDEAQAAGIDLSGGGPRPRTLLPWLPEGAFWGAVAVLIAGLAALTTYFVRRD